MVGNKILELRKKYNFSQEQLAEKINVTRQTISNWETNQTVPDAYQLKELSIVFNMSIDEILENEKYVQKENNDENILEYAKNKIKSKIKSLPYDTWVEPMEYKGTENNIIIISVPLEIQVKVLKKEYKKLILKHLNEVSTEKIREIDFVVE